MSEKTIKQPVKILYWLSLIIATAGSYYIFKDLADISQWVVQSDRDITMTVIYNRYLFTIATLSAWLISFVIWFKARPVLSNKVQAGVSFITMFSIFSGMVNPHIMMRDRNDDGLFVSVEQAKKYIAPNESVIVLEVNGQARAHADVQVLRPHVAGNGLIGGENVVMTYCGLTNLGIAYTPELDGQQLDLRPFTQLENNLVLWDANSDEVIQQIWGVKETDINSNKTNKMKEWPTFRMPFEKFTKAYPQGEVFISDYLVEDLRAGFTDNPLLAIYDTTMDLVFSMGIADQQTSDEATFPTLQHIDDRLPPKSLVWAFNVEDEYVAYTEEFAKSYGKPINTTIAGKQVVINYDQEFESLGIFYNHTGKAIEQVNVYGQTDTEQLSRVETVKAGAFWLIWANWYPQTEINPVNWNNQLDNKIELASNL